jgi:hypothetical protein
LGTSLASFATNATTITPEQIASIQLVMDAINKVTSLSGDDNRNASYLKNVGIYLTNFGDSLVTFSGAITETVINAVKSASGVIDDLKALVSSLSEVDLTAANNFTKAIADLGKSIGDDFADNIDTVPARDKVATAVSGLLGSAGTWIRANAATMTEFSEGATAVVNALTGYLGAEDVLALFSDIGTSYATNIGTGLVKSTNWTDDASSLVSIITTHIGSADNYSKMRGVGNYLASGLAAGISSKDSKLAVQTAATALANAAKAAAEETLGIESPSKVFYGIGEFVGKGFVNALNDYIDKVHAASAALAESTKNGMNNAISNIVDMLDADMDTQPTIRPVLDLTEVETGVNAISSMLNTNESLGVSANVDSVNAMMRNRQNGGDDLLTAIDKLTKKLEGIRGDSYMIGEVNYTEDDGVADAFQTIIQAARLERRT